LGDQNISFGGISDVFLDTGCFALVGEEKENKTGRLRLVFNQYIYSVTEKVIYMQINNIA